MRIYVLDISIRWNKVSSTRVTVLIIGISKDRLILGRTHLRDDNADGGDDDHLYAEDDDGDDDDHDDDVDVDGKDDDDRQSIDDCIGDDSGNDIDIGKMIILRLLIVC